MHIQSSVTSIEVVLKRIKLNKPMYLPWYIGCDQTLERNQPAVQSLLCSGL